MVKEKQKHIYIFDHPESRIRFLEATLDGQDWRATVVYPDSGPASLASLQAVSQELSQRGYMLARGTDVYGHPTLSVHHVGVGTTPVQLWQEMGIARGTMYTILNPSVSLGAYMRQAGRGVQNATKFMSDPAQANGAFFTVAEVFLTLAGFGNKSDPLPTQALRRSRLVSNVLQSMAGAFFLGQSLTYLFAKSNDDIALNSVKQQISKSAEEGKRVGSIRFDPENATPDTGLFGSVARFFKRYPIQIGAMSNNIGMGFYIWHIFAQKKLMGNIAKLSGMPEKMISEARAYSTKDWKKGLIGCCLSLIGWTTMMLPRKQSSDTAGTANPFEKLKENPQILTGVLAAGSSSMRLWESLGASKRNWIQAVGESIYLPGDFLLFGIKNDHYGSDNIKDVDGIAKRVASYINALPVVLGQQQQLEVIQNIANYLTEKRLATLTREKKLTPELHDMVVRSGEGLVKATLALVEPKQTGRLLHVVNISNRIVSRFPEAVQGELRERLNAAMLKMPWLQSDAAELQHFAKALPTLSVAQAAAGHVVSMKEVAEDISSLMKVVPDVDDATSAAALYDAFAPYMMPRQSPRTAVATASMTHADRLVTPTIPDVALV